MRKFLSEHAVNIYSARWLLLPSNQLMSEGTMNSSEAEISDNCHIYLICKHPATNFNAEQFRYENGRLSGSVDYKVGGKPYSLPFAFEFPLLDGAVRVGLTPHPHREFRTFDVVNKPVRHVPSSAVAFGIPDRLKTEHLGKFEVLYVGQAYADGRRNAVDRLRSHSTLQRILADCNYSDPDSEVLVFAFEYEPYRLVTQMDGMARGLESGDADSERFMSILSNPLTIHQQICLVEAALIRYFAPRFNEVYKQNFPSENHKILGQCYELDISALIVEINTDEMMFSLFSEHVPAAMHHIAKVDLFDRTQRLGFFHISDGDGGFLEMPNVILRGQR